MYICHPTKSPLYTFVSSYRTYTPFRWEQERLTTVGAAIKVNEKGACYSWTYTPFRWEGDKQESESPIGRPQDGSDC